ncbi:MULTISPECIES: hypothetical protein [unclassified Mesorhizobium]|uniref:hypothetical protein n=1 Tax=unclassified Mesorhizobium TaxID=325217 RepID=UPI000FCB8421|nr:MULTISPECIES: hypothetical protein [unclassified Mesorhizobium]RUV26102.1 hypothetical protein EOA91_06005 [Mesorhizobium sp. M1A.F.Ca.IN.022.04.1.1]RWG31475.1 MAG: hypothetical protein EOQ60_16105 [Mesorhizobium sp.]TIS16950.1 MAG: hypothetical protein E5X10_05590 [Mesorhizobium sp.]
MKNCNSRKAYFGVGWYACAIGADKALIIDLGVGRANRKWADREVDKVTEEVDAKWAVLETLEALYPWMRPFRSRPVRDYAFRLFEAPAPGLIPEVRSQALEKLLHIIRKAAARWGLSADTASEICRDLERRRVLQTGPHLLLLVDPEAYYTHIFSMLGLAAHGCSTYVSYAVSTVSIVERSRKGPGWLAVDGRPTNVFGLSRSQMVGYNLLSGPGSYRFEMVPVEPDAQSDALTQLRDLLPNIEFQRPAHAVKAANQVLWPVLFGSRFAFLQIDDEDIADLVAAHLSDPDSWLRASLLEEPALASNILAQLDRWATGLWSGWLTRATDFFWFYHNGKRLPLRLVAGDLIDPSTGMKVARFAASDIVARLADRTLIPNFLTAMLVVSILPGVRVLGGSHQPVFYPLMRRVVHRALEVAGIASDLRQALTTDDVSSAWGHRVIECDDDPIKRFLNNPIGGADAVVERLGATQLAEACGSLKSFVTDPSWVELHRRLGQGMIAAADEH